MDALHWSSPYWVELKTSYITFPSRTEFISSNKNFKLGSQQHPWGAYVCLYVCLSADRPARQSEHAWKHLPCPNPARPSVCPSIRLSVIRIEEGGWGSELSSEIFLEILLWIFDVIPKYIANWSQVPPMRPGQMTSPLSSLSVYAFGHWIYKSALLWTA